MFPVLISLMKKRENNSFIAYPKHNMIFDFLRYCLSNKTDMSKVIAKMDWRQLYSFASKQAIIGFCFDGIERLGREYPSLLKDNPIGQNLLMTWMGKVQQIRRRNMKVNVVASRLYRQLQGDGLRCCILKGQGNAQMYPNPYSRTPGDIDVWVNASRNDITEYAKKHFTLEDDIRYHHLETSIDDVPVELHFIPCVMNNPIYNHRLQRWFERNADLQCSNVARLSDDAGEIAVPTTAFNVIYQLCHLYHHFFDEGVGFRQMIDYYYVVCDFYKVNQISSSYPAPPSKEDSIFFPSHSFSGGGVTDPPCRTVPLRSKDGVPSVTPDYARWEHLSSIGEDCLAVLQGELKWLGLWKFAGAVMYVLHEALGLPEDRMIRPMDKKRGELLLSEIMDGGNFGKHYAKYGHFTQQGMAKKYFLKIWRNMHFVRYYPAEALSEPVFRTWHFFWRLCVR